MCHENFVNVGDFTVCVVGAVVPDDCAAGRHDVLLPDRGRLGARHRLLQQPVPHLQQLRPLHQGALLGRITHWAQITFNRANKKMEVGEENGNEKFLHRRRFKFVLQALISSIYRTIESSAEPVLPVIKTKQPPTDTSSDDSLGTRLVTAEWCANAPVSSTCCASTVSCWENCVGKRSLDHDLLIHVCAPRCRLLRRLERG